MARTTIRDLRALGVDQEDIDLALVTQNAQRAKGVPVLDLGVICGVKQPAKRGGKRADVVSLTPRQLRKRGWQAKSSKGWRSLRSWSSTFSEVATCR